MTRKKHNTGKEAPVDKIENFISNYYISILITVGIAILLVLAVYLINQILQSKSVSKYNKIGEFEISFTTGDYDNNTIEEFINMASKINAIKDYTYLKAAILFNKRGDKYKTIGLLNSVKGDFKEMRDNLLYDLQYDSPDNVNSNIDRNKYAERGNLKSLWEYRNILNNTDNTEDILQYGQKYPNSFLVQHLNNWY